MALAAIAILLFMSVALAGADLTDWDDAPTLFPSMALLIDTVGFSLGLVALIKTERPFWMPIAAVFANIAPAATFLLRGHVA